MATYGHTFTSGDTVTPTKLNNARTVSEIVDADINATADIDGTKIAPDFGSQNITTTGSLSTGENISIPSARGLRCQTDNGGIDICGGQTFNTDGAAIAVRGSSAAFNTHGIEMYAGGSERLRIDASGNVGIGAAPTANAVAKLFVAGDVTRVGQSGAFCLNSYYDAVQNQWEYAGTGTAAALSDSGSGAISLSTTGSVTGNAGDPATMTERLRINASGNVGIGTSSPSQKLNVSGGNVLVSHTQPELILNNTSSGSWKSMIRMQNSGTNKWEVGVDSSANGNNNLYFYDNAATAERMRITSGGDVLIGTTSDVDAQSGSNDGIKLDGSDKTITASRDNAATLFLRRRNGDGNVVGFYRDATYVGAVSVTTTATAYNTSSDYRLKENPQPMVGALSRLANVKPVTFTWKSNGSQGEGFIAHELQEVIPGAVTGAKDAVDADGNPQYQGVDAAKVVPYLVAAVQELSAKVAALEAA